MLPPRGDREGVLGVAMLRVSIFENDSDPVEACKVDGTVNAEEELTRSRLKALSLLPTPNEGSR